jgi:hypothetical protein
MLVSQFVISRSGKTVSLSPSQTWAENAPAAALKVRDTGGLYKMNYTLQNETGKSATVTRRLNFKLRLTLLKTLDALEVFKSLQSLLIVQRRCWEQHTIAFSQLVEGLSVDTPEGLEAATVSEMCEYETLERSGSSCVCM